MNLYGTQNVARYENKDEYSDLKFYSIFPFLNGSEKLIDEMDDDPLTALNNECVVEMAKMRITGAIKGKPSIKLKSFGNPDMDEDKIRLLSYPVSRIIVSIMDKSGLIDSLVKFESERALKNINNIITTTNINFNLSDLTSELNIDKYITKINHEYYDYSVKCPFYIINCNSELSLGDFPLHDGEVYVKRDIIEQIVKNKLQDDIIEGLPFDVPKTIERKLSDIVTDINNEINHYDFEICDEFNNEEIRNEKFPDCILDIYNRVCNGESFDNKELFVLTSFLYYIGADVDEIEQIYESVGLPNTKDYIIRISDGLYPPPTYKSLDNMNICSNKLEGHPLLDYKNK